MRNLRTLPDHGTSLYRLVVGFLMGYHGASTLFSFPVKPAGGHTGSPTVWPGGVAAVLQLTLGVLVMVGLVPRTAAVLLSGTMAYAYFSVHRKKALLPMANGGEPAALFSSAFLSIAMLGAGTAASQRIRRQGCDRRRVAVG